MELMPTKQEVEWWLLHTLKHSFHVEYFLKELQLGREDPERPHDIVGKNNKFEWEVIKGFSVQNREDIPDLFESYVKPSLELHRCQYHHRKWNDPDPSDETKHKKNSTSDDMKVGAVDAICSLLEPRGYQGGIHTFDEVQDITENKNPPHKVPWTQIILPEIKKLKQLNFEEIKSLTDFPNIGVSNHAYDVARQRIDEALKMLDSDFGYKL